MTERATPLPATADVTKNSLHSKEHAAGRWESEGGQPVHAGTHHIPSTNEANVADTSGEVAFKGTTQANNNAATSDVPEKSDNKSIASALDQLTNESVAEKYSTENTGPVTPSRRKSWYERAEETWSQVKEKTTNLFDGRKNSNASSSSSSSSSTDTNDTDNHVVTPKNASGKDQDLIGKIKTMASNIVSPRQKDQKPETHASSTTAASASSNTVLAQEVSPSKSQSTESESEKEKIVTDAPLSAGPAEGLGAAAGVEGAVGSQSIVTDSAGAA